MKKIIKLYNLKRLKERINLYGFTYSYKDYIKESLLVLALILLITYVYHLNYTMTLSIILCVLLMIPILINGLYETKYNIRRFNELSDYLSNALPIFLNKPKIVYTLKELKELTSGEINIKIKEALNYIENTVNDPKLFEHGLKIISDRFNNTRVISLHRFLINVERCDSSSYQLIADSLYMDIENWIKRVSLYEKELMDKRNKLIILCLSSLVINSLFVYIYENQEFFNGFALDFRYQLSTTIFIILITLVITICMSTMSGSWLVDDLRKIDERKLKKIYVRYKDNSVNKRINIVISILFGLCGGYFYYLGYLKLTILALVLIFITNNINKIKTNKAKKKLKKYFEISFPLWLREVSLSLGNLTILNSITNSIKSFEYPLRKELRNFIREAGDNPLSIKPYNEFLNEYEIDGLRSSMRILFSLNSLAKDNLKERLSFLSERNQELLAKSESITNTNRLSFMELLGFIPIVLFTGETLISMGLMFSYVINNLGVNIGI